MGKKSKLKPHLTRPLANREERQHGTVRPSKIVFTLTDIDVSQGQSFQEWEAEGLAGALLEKLRSIGTLTRIEAQQQQVIKPYPKVDFPPQSDFTHPKHVPDDITWCSMHLQGKECIIGYFDLYTPNLFSVIFLDKDHRFWISQKK